jgi:type II secretory pathway pseudopilin PulG
MSFSPRPAPSPGYSLIVLLFAVALLVIGLMVAVPVWQTQVRRAMEEELIFRGNQYVEAIRIFQTKKPGSFPKNLDELLEEKCLRKMFKDPMTKHGEWNIILPYRGISSNQESRSSGFTPQQVQSMGQGQESFQKVLVVPAAALEAIDNPQIIGVVSSSTRNSIKIYYEQETYDTWLFFYGFDPEKMPEIVHYGQEEER